VNHLNGIFAFAIWDERKEELFLARDRMGVKPLYYATRGSAILFGSEPKALLANSLVKSEIDEEGLAEIFFMLGQTPGNGIYKDVHELRPGHTLLFLKGGSRLSQYWKLESHPHPDDLEKTVKNVRELLFDIVNRQLISDVPICTLLSGGLDSSGITAIAGQIKKEQGEKIHTFSVDYKDSSKHFQSNDLHVDLDSPWVKMVTDFVGTAHHDILLDTPDLISHFFTPLAARDLPSLGDMDTSLYLLFKELKKHATVALSGESADEVFGGYPWFHAQKAIELETFPWLYQRGDVGILSPELSNELNLQEYTKMRYREALAEVPTLPGESKMDQRIREIFYMNLTYFLPMLLDRKDRMSMAVGLEVRVPFCDHRLVEYVWNIPWEMKNSGGMEKGILRKALQGLLPEQVLNRKKSAYPTSHNPSYGLEIALYMKEILNDKSSPVLQLIDTKKISMMVDRQSKESNSLLEQGAIRVFSYLIQINAWLQDYNVGICLGKKVV
jgi:asparagine synthase (glutamine-hydrolysing)